jgi:hypothetical protein
VFIFILVYYFVRVFMSSVFTRESESHGYQVVDEWLSVQGYAPPCNLAKQEVTGVNPWSFTFELLASSAAGI